MKEELLKALKEAMKEKDFQAKVQQCPGFIKAIRKG